MLRRNEIRMTQCGYCFGQASEQKTIAGDFTGVWLHLFPEDWRDDPHDVDVTEVRIITRDTNGHRVEKVAPR